MSNASINFQNYCEGNSHLRMEPNCSATTYLLDSTCGSTTLVATKRFCDAAVGDYVIYLKDDSQYSKNCLFRVIAKTYRESCRTRVTLEHVKIRERFSTDLACTKVVVPEEKKKPKPASQQKTPLPPSNFGVRSAFVRFDGNPEEYEYLTRDSTIKSGDRVVVPVQHNKGCNTCEGLSYEATVSCLQSLNKYPKQGLKWVISKISCPSSFATEEKTTANSSHFSDYEKTKRNLEHTCSFYSITRFDAQCIRNTVEAANKARKACFGS